MGVLRALAGAAWSYTRLAVWGLAVGERRDMQLVQAVILDERRGVLLAERSDLRLSLIHI